MAGVGDPPGGDGGGGQSMAELGGLVAVDDQLAVDDQRAAVVTIQGHFRGKLRRREYQQQRRGAIHIQARYRGRLRRRNFREERRAAIRIQASIRGRLYRQHHGPTRPGPATSAPPPAWPIPAGSILSDAKLTGHETPIAAIAKIYNYVNYTTLSPADMMKKITRDEVGRGRHACAATHSHIFVIGRLSVSGRGSGPGGVHRWYVRPSALVLSICCNPFPQVFQRMCQRVCRPI